MGRRGRGPSGPQRPESPEVYDPPCDICGLDPGSDCYCMECSVCGSAGDIRCYNEHLVNWVQRLTPDLQAAARRVVGERLKHWNRTERRACDWCFGYWQEAGAPEDHPPHDGHTIIVDSGGASLVCSDHFDEYREDPDEVPDWEAVVFLPVPDAPEEGT